MEKKERNIAMEKLFTILIILWIAALLVVTVMACFNPSYAAGGHHVAYQHYRVLI